MGWDKDKDNGQLKFCKIAVFLKAELYFCCLLYGQALADFSAIKRHSYTKDSRKCYEIINLLSKLIALLAGMMLPPPQDSKCTPFVLGC